MAWGYAGCSIVRLEATRRPNTSARTDYDPLYRFHQWQANLRILDVKEIKTVPYLPLSHPFVERLIGTCPSPISRPGKNHLTLAPRLATLRAMRDVFQTVAAVRLALSTRRDLLLENLALRTGHIERCLSRHLRQGPRRFHRRRCPATLVFCAGIASAGSFPGTFFRPVGELAHFS